MTLAARQGLAAIALTDHDTVDGVRQILKLSLPDSLQFLTGIELSAAPPAGTAYTGSIHILGYGFDADRPGLLEVTERLTRARARRIPRIIEKLRQAGIDIDRQEVDRRIGRGAAGRPHIAEVLVEKGIVEDIDSAFDLWLAKGRPGYVDKYRLPAEQAIATIRQAGGVAVLAHPWLIFKAIDRRLEDLVAGLSAMGLDGLEALYPKHPPRAVGKLKEMARRFGLIVTGGTDFHGAITPEIQLGKGSGDFRVPYEIFLKLKQRIAQHRQNQL